MLSLPGAVSRGQNRDHLWHQPFQHSQGITSFEKKADSAATMVSRQLLQPADCCQKMPVFDRHRAEGVVPVGIESGTYQQVVGANSRFKIPQGALEGLQPVFA